MTYPVGSLEIVPFYTDIILSFEHFLNIDQYNGPEILLLQL